MLRRDLEFCEHFITCGRGDVAGSGRACVDSIGQENKVVKNDVSELRRFAVMLNDANDAITMQDLQGNILAWNRAAIKMYGYTETEALKMNIKDLAPEGRMDEISGYLDKISQGILVESFETTRQKKNGDCIDVWLVVTCLKNEAGEIDSLATTERDITHIKNELRVYQEILHVCSSCKAIQNDDGKWQPIEYYIQEHSSSRSACSHSLCPECAEKLYPEFSLYKQKGRGLHKPVYFSPEIAMNLSKLVAIYAKFPTTHISLSDVS